MTTYPLILICALIAFALLACVSCSRHPSQQEMEARTLNWVRRQVMVYEALNPGTTITNLEQVFRGPLKREYPHYAHDDFRPYGKYAGFKTSFFEKYVFFAPGTTSRWVQGELLFMNAQPFPLRSQKGMGRRVVARNQHATLNEEQVQQMLTEEGIKPLPLGAISPPPPRPPDTGLPVRFRVQEKFFHACNKLGLGIEATLNLWRIFVFSPLLLLVLVGIWFWRSSGGRGVKAR